MEIIKFKKAFKRLKRSTKNFADLIARDPLDFLDFEANLDQNLKELIFEISKGIYRPQKPYLHASAKSKGINRPTVILDIKDALVYRFCLEAIEDELLEKVRRNNIRGGMKIKAIKTPSGDSEYEKWFDDWVAFNNSIAKDLNRKKYLVATDIASYYEGINLLVLKDLVRSDVSKKQKTLDLLFYFLESTNFRYNYRVNTMDGLLQENIDCSRLLAYYFLKEHDQKIIDFCKESKGDYYRFVDDVCILVDSEYEARHVLKVSTDSLRNLGLVASIEKTSILKANEAKKQLFIEENNKLNNYEQKLIKKIKNKDNVTFITKEIQGYYQKLAKEKGSYKNWIKVLKRFYTLFAYANSAFLLPEMTSHLVKFPSMFSERKLAKYLIRNQKNKEKFNKALLSLIKYLYSQENLYPSLESQILEIFLYFNKIYLSKYIIAKIGRLAEDIFFKKNYTPLSEYARGLSCLLYHRYNKKNVINIAKHYIKSKENDFLLKKYLIFTSLTVDNQNLRVKVLNKAKMEQNLSINRLVSFIENIDTYRNHPSVKNYLRRDGFYIFYKKASDKQKSFELLYKYKPIRAEILKQLIDIYKD